MMGHAVGTTTWLCCIFLSLLPFVQCQFPGVGGFGRPNPFSSGAGRGPLGNPFPDGGFGGGNFPDRFPQGFRPGQNQPFGQSGQTRPQSVDEEQGEEMPEEEVSAPNRGPAAAPPEEEEAPAPPVAAPASTATDVAEAPAPIIEPISAAPIVEEPTAIPEAPAETSAEVAPAPVLVPTFSTPFNGLFTSSGFVYPEASSSPPTTTTVTMSMTVIVTPSPGAESAIPESNIESAAATATPTESPVADAAPLTSSPSNTMSASARAGVGVGVTFGIIGIASVTGFYLWRRYQNRKYNRSDDSDSVRGFMGGGFGGFGNLFTLHRKGSAKSDSEWEIASAEKVEIVRGASARTLSRSDSHSTQPGRGGTPLRNGSTGNDGAGGGEKTRLQILKVGMRVPARENHNHNNLALTSNPPSLPSPSEFPMPSPSQFPTPPSSRGTIGTVGSRKDASSWPLPE